MLETELAFVNNVNDITNFIEMFLKKLLKTILNLCIEEIESYYELTGINRDNYVNTLNRIISEKFITITYNEAFNILINNSKKKFKSIPRNGESFAKEHELFLVEYNNNVPIFIVEWPEDSKPFYMKSSINSSNKVLYYYVNLTDVYYQSG